jgi:hypothetical protein
MDSGASFAPSFTATSPMMFMGEKSVCFLQWYVELWYLANALVL